ncbi:MAG: hypothetical protein R2799_00375 [Crocinitomicaceae bacterium]
MKNKIYFLIVLGLFLGSCSTGNLSFSKRKYTKGKYKPERGNYNVAKADKAEETKYVVSHEKNEKKQNFKSKKENNSKKELATKNEKHVVKNDESSYAENAGFEQNTEPKVSDNVIINENKTPKVTDPILEEGVVAPTALPESAPSADVSLILGIISLILGIVAFIIAIVAFFSLAWAGWVALALGIIAIGTGIAALIMDGSVMGYIGMSFGIAAIALFLIWLIIWLLI